MTDIIIIGGGISGLTTAHELCMLGYKVTIIERNDIVGGLARTYQNKENKICPYEYSWRAYASFYYNVYNIMKQIPYDGNLSVYDKLLDIEEKKVTCNKNYLDFYNKRNTVMRNMPLHCKFLLLQYLCSCNKRNCDNFSDIKIKDYINDSNISIEIENILGKSVGPILGFDYQFASLYDLLHFYEMLYNNKSNKTKTNITSLPTSYVWFDKWVDLLKSKGVIFLLNTETISYNINNNIITSITVLDKLTNKFNKYIANYFINCTGPEILSKLLKQHSNISKNINVYYNNIDKVATLGRQQLLSVYYYLDTKIYLRYEYSCIYLPNTPWLLMVLPTGHIWGDSFLSEYCDSKIKEVVSIAICESHIDGLLIKKPWSECTVDEIKIETWFQLINDKDFINSSCINKNINDINIIDFKLWDSYIFKDGKLDTFEPKWSNNINTIKYRPTNISPFKNLIISGAYTKTSVNFYSMEGAVESGKMAAKTLCKIDNKKENIYLHIKKTFKIFKIMRFIDEILYLCNLNFFHLILIILFYIFILRKK